MAANSSIEPQKETWNEGCPWCGRYIRDLWDYGSYEREFDLECPHCEQPINAQRVVVIEYCLRPARAGRLLDGREHSDYPESEVRR